MRRLALLLVDAAAALLPAALKPWGRAMRHEVAAIERGSAAFLFALGCLGVALRAAAFDAPGDRRTMNMTDQPRRLTAICAIAATGLGMAYMAAGGAPLRYFVINAGALALAFATLAAAAPLIRSARISAGGVNLMLGAVLLLLTLFGLRVDGATRWISLAGLSIQPSLIVLPMLAIGFARSRDALSLAGIGLAALALALQPDRAMSGALAAGMAALMLVRPEREVLIALTAAAGGFAATLLQADSQGAMPFVDQILYTSFAVHPLAGLAVLLGSILLIVPAAVGCLTDSAHRETHATSGALWFAAIAAAAIGNYPTPLVGYGGSAIIGYMLCLLVLPRRTQGAVSTRAPAYPGAAPSSHLPRSAAFPLIAVPQAAKPC
jgi:hypothetical protein